MNRTILIAGGAAIASLAVGTAGGYLFAKKRFEKGLPELIEKETDAVKKHYALQLMEARSGKPASPADIPKQPSLLGLTETLRLVEPDDEEEVAPGSPKDLTPADMAVREKGRVALAKAKAALTDYNGISTTAVKEDGVSSEGKQNIFDVSEEVTPKKATRYRDDKGHFRKPTPREAASEPPEIVDADVFLNNVEDWDQESLLYFVRDKTLVLEADPNEAIDNDRIGEVNLTLFPQVPEGDPCMIFVRNSALKTLYEVKKMGGSLTEYFGLGEDGEDHDDGAKYL